MLTAAIAAVAFVVSWLSSMAVAYGWYRAVWVRQAERFGRFRLSKSGGGPAQLRNEKRHAWRAGWVAGVAVAIVAVGVAKGWTQLYVSLSSRPLWLTPAMLGVAIVAHDAYFYWTHRMMHLPWLYRRVHAIHHASRNPTPIGAIAMHPLEAAVETAFIPLAAYTLPMHAGAFAGFVALMGVANMIGHLGHELRVPRSRVFSATRHHFLHHQAVTVNYGAYFRFWDRVMGTSADELPSAAAAQNAVEHEELAS